MKNFLNVKKTICFAAVIFIFCGFSFGVFADDIVTEKTISTNREITGDSMKWEYEAGRALFTGNVIMKSSESEIRCLKMTLLFDEKDEIEKILAEEHATLIKEKQKGGAETIEIYPDKNIIVLKQNAWISSDKATFRGEEITFNTEKETINITKGVKGEIQTGSEEEIKDIEIQ
jgi:lipopolysaccharide transport protein LptA